MVRSGPKISSTPKEDRAASVSVIRMFRQIQTHHALEYPSHMRSRANRLCVLIIGLTAAMLGWGFFRNSRIGAQFDRVNVGASKEQVVRLLGTPSWIEPCGKSFGTRKPNCTEYIYRNPFAPLVPEFYSVSFDTSGHVVDKDVYSSP